MKSSFVPVLATATLVITGVWLILGSNVFKSMQTGNQPVSIPAPSAAEKTAKQDKMSGKDSKAALKTGSRSRKRTSAENTPILEVNAVPVEMPHSAEQLFAAPVHNPFPLRSDIPAGTPRAQVREKFGDPDLIATGADRGLLEMYVYHRKSDGKLTSVHLKDGVVEAR